MRRYGRFDTMDELINHYMPMMKAERKFKENRRKALGLETSSADWDEEEEVDEEKKKQVEDLLTLLYAMEHMPAEELDVLQRQCEKDLEEINEQKKKMLK